MGVSLVAEFVTEVLAECRTVLYASPQVGIVWAALGSLWGASGEPLGSLGSFWSIWGVLW